MMTRMRIYPLAALVLLVLLAHDSQARRLYASTTRWTRNSERQSNVVDALKPYALYDADPSSAASRNLIASSNEPFHPYDMENPMGSLYLESFSPGDAGDRNLQFTCTAHYEGNSIITPYMLLQTYDGGQWQTIDVDYRVIHAKLAFPLSDMCKSCPQRFEPNKTYDLAFDFSNIPIVLDGEDGSVKISVNLYTQKVKVKVGIFPAEFKMTEILKHDVFYMNIAASPGATGSDTILASIMVNLNGPNPTRRVASRRSPRRG